MRITDLHLLCQIFAFIAFLFGTLKEQCAGKEIFDGSRFGNDHRVRNATHKHFVIGLGISAT